MYMTKDFAKTQGRKFNAYPIGVMAEPDKDDAAERQRQQEEHRVREANAKKRKKDK